MKLQLHRFLLVSIFILAGSLSICAQKDIAPILPLNGANNVNVGIIKWSANEGNLFDLYLGTSPNPGLYKSDLQIMEEKPVILELNQTYYWKIVEKMNGKEIRTSKVFSFSTLPITLNPGVKYDCFVDTRDYRLYWTITVNKKVWFVQNLDYDLQGMSWYYNNSETNKAYGRLYSGHSLTTNPGDICPEGWHIPTQNEWADLINAFGGMKIAGKSFKETTDMFWRKSNFLRTNESGLTVLPAGSRDSKPEFSNIGKYTIFWSSTPNPEIVGSFYTIDLGFMRDNLKFDVGSPQWSYSIRCVKD